MHILSGCRLVSSVVAAAVSPAAAPALLLSVVSSVLLPQPANVPMHIAAASKVAVNLFIIANFSSAVKQFFHALSPSSNFVGR